MPSVSVIIPAYNHGEFILETIQSVLEQTFQDFEVIVVNDGSPDDTEDRLSFLIRQKSIRYFRQANQGQSKARNFGLSKARGKYVAFLDDDDLWPKDKLAWQVERLEKDLLSVLVYGDMRPFQGDAPYFKENPPSVCQELPSGKVTESFLVKNHIISPGQTLIRLDTLRSIGGFDEQIWGVDDYDLYIRLSKLGNFAYSPYCSLFYRQHAANASRNVSRMYQNARKVRRKHLGRWPSFENVSIWIQSEFAFRKQFFDIYMNSFRANSFSGSHLIAAAMAVYPCAVFHRSFWKAVKSGVLG